MLSTLLHWVLAHYNPYLHRVLGMRRNNSNKLNVFIILGITWQYWRSIFKFTFTFSFIRLFFTWGNFLMSWTILSLKTCRDKTQKEWRPFNVSSLCSVIVTTYGISLTRKERGENLRTTEIQEWEAWREVKRVDLPDFRPLIYVLFTLCWQRLSVHVYVITQTFIFFQAQTDDHVMASLEKWK